MTRDDAKQFVLQQEPYFLQAAKKIGGKQSYVCPKCGSGSGKNGTGITKDTSASANKMHPHYKCFGECKGYYDIVELFAIRNGLENDDPETYNRLYSYYGLDIDTHNAPDGHRSADKAAAVKSIDPAPEPQQEATEEPTADYTAYYIECRDRLQSSPEAISYLQARGISPETAAKYWIGFDPKADPAKSNHPAARIIIPTSKGHYIGRCIDDEHTDKPYRKLNVKGGKPHIFNHKALYGGAEVVFIVEGWADALAVIEAGGTAAALNSTSNYKLLVSMLEAKRTDATIVIALDTDNEGATTSRELAEELARIGAEHITAELNGGYNDPSEAYTQDKEAFIERVKAAERMAQRTYLDEFLEAIQAETYKPYQTGINFFDNLLDGGVIKQTVLLLMAAPATGKTTLCLQIAEQMAAAGKPVVYLNFEMSREQLLAKNISYKLAREDNIFLSALDVMQGYKWNSTQRQQITAAINDYRENIYPYLKCNPEGATSDLKGLLEYLQQIGQNARTEGKEAPAVFVDYLHLITSSEGLEAQEIIKQAVLGLKQYAIDYNTFAVAIIASNRASNKTGKLTMESGRDSSSLEYTADYQISLNYEAIDNGTVKPDDEPEIAKLQQAPDRAMILRLLKNRFGIQGKAVKVTFNAKCNIFVSEGATVGFINAPEVEQLGIFKEDSTRKRL